MTQMFADILLTAALLSSDTRCICWCGLMQASRVNTSVRAELAKRSTGKEGGYLEMMRDKLASFLKNKRSIQMISTQTAIGFCIVLRRPDSVKQFLGVSLERCQVDSERQESGMLSILE